MISNVCSFSAVIWIRDGRSPMFSELIPDSVDLFLLQLVMFQLAQTICLHLEANVEPLFCVVKPPFCRSKPPK